eukprot:8361269-Pyramimonas_sp.AAC.1
MFKGIAVVASQSERLGVPRNIALGKTDFQSAFKTLPPDKDQEWMCWSLIFNPELGRYQVAPLWSHVFGNLGGVAGWYRTARALQHIATKTFSLP